MELRRIFSSHIGGVGYDAHSQELWVEFQNGKTAVYQGVPPDVARMVTDAPSVGTALNQFIKGKYGFGYLAGGQK